MQRIAINCAGDISVSEVRFGSKADISQRNRHVRLRYALIAAN